jgi:hypothetical protein
MSFAIFKGETSIKDMVNRLFNLPKTSSKSAANKASDAAAADLLQANPQLSDLSKVPVGTLITIPVSAPPLKPGEEVSPQQTRRAAIAVQALQSLSALNQRLAQVDARAVSTASALLAIAQSQPTQDLATQNTSLKQQLPGLIASLQASVAEAPTAQAARSSTLSTSITRLQLLVVK